MYNQQFIERIKDNEIYPALTLILSKNDEIRVRVEGLDYEEIVKSSYDHNKINNIIHRLESVYYKDNPSKKFSLLYNLPMSNIIVKINENDGLYLPISPKFKGDLVDNISFTDYDNNIMLKVYDTDNTVIYNKIIPKYKTFKFSDNKIEMAMFAGIELSKQ